MQRLHQETTPGIFAIIGTSSLGVDLNVVTSDLRRSGANISRFGSIGLFDESQDGQLGLQLRLSSHILRTETAAI